MSSNGRTADSGSVNGGSTPSIPAICAACFSLLARSSSGSGRRPLKAEITGSNPVRATKSFRSTRKLLYITARSSSGSGRRPLKAEITGSNPVRATKLFFWRTILLVRQIFIPTTRVHAFITTAIDEIVRFFGAGMLPANSDYKKRQCVPKSPSTCSSEHDSSAPTGYINADYRKIINKCS